MPASVITPEDLTAVGRFVDQALTEHPDRALPIALLIDTLRDVERVEGAVLDGLAVELGRRLAQLHGLPMPSFPDEFHADISALSDRGLAVCVLRQAQRLDDDAGLQSSCEARFLVLGVARLLAADPLILPPGFGG